MRHVDIAQRLRQAAHAHPLDWIHLGATAAATAKHRLVSRCIGPATIVGRNTRMLDPRNIRVGSHCLILDHVYLRAGQQGRIQVGDYCAINTHAKLFGHGGIVIGDYTQLGPGSLITTTTHDFDDRMKTSFAPVRLAEWVWVGAGAIILPGVTIGEHAVIGAGSIVTKDLPAYSVAVGNPARVIRERPRRQEAS